MARVFPFSQRTAARLAVPPAAGETHRWLAQVASGLSSAVSADACAAFLRRTCDEHVGHRRIPEREIAGAVALAYGGRSQDSGFRSQGNFGRRALGWPAASDEVVGRVLGAVEPAFDGERSTGLRPGDVLPLLFRPGELVCVGADSERAVVRPVEEILTDAECLQFICLNPMRGSLAMNHAGRPSVRCQNNVALRRYLVAEFDDERRTKREQAQLATALGAGAPLVLAVDSGGKSVHAWYHVERLGAREQARFFAAACVVGADPTRWDVCGWLRMPGGLRMRGDGTVARQRVLHFRGGA